MRQLMATSILLFCANLACAHGPQLSGWKLVWSDEFNYVGHPDSTKWGYEEGYVRHNELQYYTVSRLENARVDGHNLLIELRKETPASLLPTSINDEWHRYTSASLNTRNTASWTYGRFEIMAKMPRGPRHLAGDLVSERAPDAQYLWTSPAREARWQGGPRPASRA
jgi:beta-glucanase (GH16 family)